MSRIRRNEGTERTSTGGIDIGDKAKKFLAWRGYIYSLNPEYGTYGHDFLKWLFDEAPLLPIMAVLENEGHDELLTVAYKAFMGGQRASELRNDQESAESKRSGEDAEGSEERGGGHGNHRD